MPKYKLIYFDIPGRAEVARIMFHHAGEKFEDKRVSQEEWAKLKPGTMFGGLPMLEVDGETLCQSGAIDRLLAKRFGLAGKTDMEQAKVDMVIGCFEDTMKPAGAMFAEKDEAKKAQLKKHFQDEHLPASMAKMEKLLKTNKGGDGYFVGDNMTLADITVSVVVDMPPTLLGVQLPLDKFPKIKALKARVESKPRIAQYLANRA